MVFLACLLLLVQFICAYNCLFRQHMFTVGCYVQANLGTLYFKCSLTFWQVYHCWWSSVIIGRFGTLTVARRVPVLQV